MILRAFPPEPYYGTIVAGGDNGPWNPELDDQDLYLTLKNQRWTDTPIDFLARHLGDFVLLTAEAFAAFLPAWLLFSLDNEYQGAEFVAHTFAPDDTTSPSGPGELQARESQTGELKIRQLSIEMFRPLTASQRRIVRAFLEHVAQYHPSSFIADRAAAAAHTVDNLILVFESGHL